MTNSNHIDSHDFETLPIRMHPRVFSALGVDLVTSDIVAVIELVKNSYDAFAQNVWVRFGNDQSLGPYLEIEDDGKGMTRDIIQNVWCLVATPYKAQHPTVTNENRTRRVAGEKGLGRLSTARLGTRLQMVTAVQEGACWEVVIDWSEITKGDDLSNSYANFREYPGIRPFESGTRLQIYNLKEKWEDAKLLDLEENLARLVSPFEEIGDFNILLTRLDSSHAGAVKIVAPSFLNRPKYCIRGNANNVGDVSGTYLYNPISNGSHRSKKLSYSWKQIYDSIQDPTRYRYSDENANCGPFSFEIRAWDLATDDTNEIAEKFELRKSEIRKAIRAHKGISVYRDGILVLPKSENARDWLGLDLRRVSKVGIRLSTSQLVGYVSITAEHNPRIEDTSDRERLVSSIQLSEFEEILKAIVALLENERDEDRAKPEREKPLDDLFGELSAEDLWSEISLLTKEQVSISEVVPLLREFKSNLDSARKAIQDRFVYYSRLATVGTIAHMLVHEIRNRTTAIGAFLDLIHDRYGPVIDESVKKDLRSAESAVDTLERLADTFAPLASRSFRRRKRYSVLEDQIRDCIGLHKYEIEKNHINCHLLDSTTKLAVDPGELNAILLNLIVNSVYWLREVPTERRELRFKLKEHIHKDRVVVEVQDTGPGIDEDDIQRVFLPGVTRKPGGIGMGLTVAAELVSVYDGRMSTQYRGATGGAVFAFDLPLKD